MNSAPLILGIDTGGTFTDGVLMDAEGTIYTKTKSLTTKQDLSIGICKCINQLSTVCDTGRISLVCLSTTLATNSVVEGKVSRIGLITMDDSYNKSSYEVSLHKDVAGLLDLDGSEKEKINEAEVTEALADMKGKVDSLVVSGYYSVRNPVHEKRIKEMAADILNVPVICGHELSMSLGYHERTLTAVLNAHLLPVIDDLIRKTRTALQQNNIDAQVAVIKGDGTMMDEKQALQRPVETVLSGPAASVIGGAFLTDKQNALFVDLGGTTTDIAYMENGKVAVDEDGSVVNGWKTKARAVNMFTFGLGGDSRLKETKGSLEFGPMKAIPICYASHCYPYLAGEFSDAKSSSVKLLEGFHHAEGLMLRKLPDDISSLGSTARRLAELLKDGPHTITYICRHLEKKYMLFSIDHLIKNGLLDVISITPTDLLHASGEFIQWDSDASIKAIQTMASINNAPYETVLSDLKKKFSNQLLLAIMQSAFCFDGKDGGDAMNTSWLKSVLFDSNNTTRLQCTLAKDIVALGAPAKAWIEPLAQSLNTIVLTPENHDVSNAIGAARGKISRRIEILIARDFDLKLCRLHTSWGVYEKGTLNEARKFALSLFDQEIAKIEDETGIYNYTRNLDEKTSYIQSKVSEIFMSMEISAAPDCLQK